MKRNTTQARFDIANHETPFIRYMGGKQYACKKLATYLPPNLKEMVSPFIGGGSFELYCGSVHDIRVHAYDNLPTLVRHWNIMLTRAGEVMRTANEIFPVKRRILKDLIVNEKLYDASHVLSQPEKDVVFAAIAMCMTRQGFNGYYMKTSYFRGPYDPDDHDLENPEDAEIVAKDAAILARFDPWDEGYWDTWKNDNLSVGLQDWEVTLKKHNNDFLFMDPPYLGLEDYYGQYETKKTQYTRRPFNHEYLAECFANHKNGGIVTYQNDPKGVIKSLYKDFEVIETQWHQGSIASQQKHKDGKKELIILKEPAGRPSKRAILSQNIGDVENIGRLYGNHNPKHEKPKTLCEFIEGQFSAFDPQNPPRKSMDSILSVVNYCRYTCTKDDVRGIIKYMVDNGIIIEDKDNFHKYPYYGYPKSEITDMNVHIKDMAENNITVKAVPCVWYEYKETN